MRGWQRLLPTSKQHFWFAATEQVPAAENCGKTLPAPSNGWHTPSASRKLFFRNEVPPYLGVINRQKTGFWLKSSLLVPCCILACPLLEPCLVKTTPRYGCSPGDKMVPAASIQDRPIIGLQSTYTSCIDPTFILP
jgi:hypothetical protein